MPDVNSLDLNPYAVETAAGVPWGYQYAVELDFGDQCSEELSMLVCSFCPSYKSLWSDSPVLPPVLTFVVMLLRNGSTDNNEIVCSSRFRIFQTTLNFIFSFFIMVHHCEILFAPIFIRRSGFRVT